MNETENTWENYAGTVRIEYDAPSITMDPSIEEYMSGAIKWEGITQLADRDPEFKAMFDSLMVQYYLRSVECST